MSFGIPVRNGLSVSLVSSTFLSSGRRLNPALNLDFLTGGTLDPRITFSRTSQATLVDATGKLTYAPNNLMTNSESFEASAWSVARCTITANSTAAPDGTTTADTLVEDTTTNSHPVYRTIAGFSAGAMYVFSCYIKAFGRTKARLALASTAFPSSQYVDLDLTAGTATGGNSPTSVGISAVGNGWYRCYLTVPAGASGNGDFYIEPRNAAGTTNYLGNGAGALYLWGAQLEQVTYQTTPGTYNSTSPKNLLGYTQEFDNAAWTKSNAFVQTNLLTYSQEFDNAVWSKTNSSISANTIAAPDGTITADTANEGTATGVHSSLQTFSSTSGVSYVFSVYLKNGDGRYAQIFFGGAGHGISAFANFDLQSGTVGTVGSTATASIANVGNGWYRCTIISAATATSASASAQIASITSSTSARAENYTGTSKIIYLWGAQLVQGSTAGDYQRTDAAAAAVQYVAPDGSRTADKLVEDTVNTTHRTLNNIAVTVPTSGPSANTIYVKAGERTAVQLTDNDIQGADFDLITGAVSNLGTGVTATATGVGNGWWRLSVIRTNSTGSGRIVLYIMSGGNTSYTGDGTSGIYIWGAQLSNSASLDPYVYNPVAAPTSAAYYGPRFDYDPVTLANKGLLIEEQRTNLLLYSDQFNNTGAWATSAGTVTANAITSPDGTVNADAFIADTANALHYLSSSFGSAITTYTVSFYAKSAGYRLVVFTNNGGTNQARGFDLSNGTTFTNTSGYSEPISSSITPVGNGWYRCSMTFNKTVATSCGIGIWLNNGVSDTFAGNGTSGVYLYGAQLEAGSFATSYIPTVASQVTRTADVALMQGANFSNWYNQEAGTVSLEGDTIGYTLNQMAVSITDGTITNPIQIYNNSGLQLEANVWSNGTVLSAFTYNSLFKYALGVATNNVGASLNGGSVVSDLSVGPSVAYNRLNIGNRNGSLFWNGHIRRIGYYNTRLPNTALVSLTAPNIIPSLSLDFTTQVFNVG